MRNTGWQQQFSNVYTHWTFDTYNDINPGQKGIRSLDQWVWIPKKADMTFWELGWKWNEYDWTGGYIGLQTLGGPFDMPRDLKPSTRKTEQAIFSLWCSLEAKPAKGSTAKRFGGEGYGWNITRPFVISENSFYRFRVEFLEDNGNLRWWQASIAEVTTNGDFSETLLGSIGVGGTPTFGLEPHNFTEYFGRKLEFCEEVPMSIFAVTPPMGNYTSDAAPQPPYENYALFKYWKSPKKCSKDTGSNSRVIPYNFPFTTQGQIMFHGGRESDYDDFNKLPPRLPVMEKLIAHPILKIAEGSYPSMVVFKEKLFLVHFHKNGDSFQVFESIDGIVWGKIYTSSIRRELQYRPSLAVMNNTLYMVFVWQDTLYSLATIDGSNWEEKKFLNPQTAGESPSLTVFNNTLYVAYRKKSNIDLHISWLMENGEWSDGVPIPTQKSYNNQSLVNYKEKLYLVYREGGHLSSQHLLITSSIDGKNWPKRSNKIQDQKTRSGPAAAVFYNKTENKLCIAYRAGSNDRIIFTASDDGSTWEKAGISLNQYTSGSPLLLQFDQKLWLTYQYNGVNYMSNLMNPNDLRQHLDAGAKDAFT